MNQVRVWRNSIREEEVHNLVSAVSEERFSEGGLTAEFEAYLAAAVGAPYAVATTSGSVALLMALMACKIGHGDEVILPNRSSIASAHAPLLLGARLRVIDVQDDSPTIDVTKIFSCLSRRTKAIIVPHPNGRSGNMEAIRQIADEYDLLVIEDASQALLSRNSKGYLGTFGKVGCFSLGMTKLLTTGQGGVVVTSDEHIYNKLLALRNHGKGNKKQHTQLGFNFKFTDMQAAIGLAQSQCVRGRIDRLQEIYRLYAATVSEIPFVEMMPVNVDVGEVPLSIEIFCEERDRLTGFLNAQGIETQCLHPSLGCYRHIHANGYFPNSETYDLHGLQLPSGPGQSLDDVKYVLDTIQRYADICHPMKIAC